MLVVDPWNSLKLQEGRPQALKFFTRLPPPKAPCTMTCRPAAAAASFAACSRDTMQLTSGWTFFACLSRLPSPPTKASRSTHKCAVQPFRMVSVDSVADHSWGSLRCGAGGCCQHFCDAAVRRPASALQHTISGMNRNDENRETWSTLDVCTDVSMTFRATPPPPGVSALADPSSDLEDRGLRTPPSFCNFCNLLFFEESIRDLSLSKL